MTGQPPAAQASPGLLRSAAVYGGSNVLQRVIPLLILPVLTYYLSTSDVGMIAVFTAAVGIATPLVGVNISYAVRRRYFDADGDGFAIYLANGLGLLAAGTVVLLAAVVTIGGPITRVTGLPVGWLAAAVVLAALQEFLQVPLTIFQVERQPVRYARVQVTKSAVAAGLTAILVIALAAGWHGAVVAMLLTAALVALLVGVPALASRITWRYDTGSMRHALRYGGGLIPHTLGTMGIRSIDRFMIAYYSTASENGLYSVGAQVGLAVSLVADGFNRAWSPWLYAGLAENDPATDRRIVRLAYTYFAAIAGVAALVWLAGPLVVRLILAREFHPAGRFVGWVVLGLAFNGMYLVIAGMVFYSGKTLIVSAITICSATLSVAFMFLLVPRSGAMGAAQATALAFFLKFVLTWIAANRLRPMPWLLSRARITAATGAHHP